MNFTIEANHLKENKLNIHVPLDIEILCELFPLLTFEVNIIKYIFYTKYYLIFILYLSFY